LSEGHVDGILDRGGTILGTSNRSDPFCYVVRDEEGNAREIDLFDQVLENYHALGLEALISIGGDGSMRIAQQCIERGMTQIVGVPKTIDNDLLCTDYTFGFNSAVQVATEAIDRLHDTACSHDRVIVVEVMGRDAGWIALHAGLAGGAHAILVPEIPYRIEPIVRKIKDRREAGNPYSIIVVSEAARPIDGEQSLLGERELGAMKRFFGAAGQLSHQLSERIELQIRHTVLGHIQRGGSPTAFDRILGTRFGEKAVELVARGEFGTMVALRGTDVVGVPLAEAVNAQKLIVPNHDDLLRTARNVGIVFGDETD
ncbi:MAG: ATP-dependent 6-phosphofructokinase, partial [Myxococcota bacterium]